MSLQGLHLTWAKVTSCTSVSLADANSWRASYAHARAERLSHTRIAWLCWRYERNTCDAQDAVTARTLAFAKEVRTRCVTLEGDDFNPSGTLTGAPHAAPLLTAPVLDPGP